VSAPPALAYGPLDCGLGLLVLTVLSDLAVDVERPAVEVELLQRHGARLSNAQSTPSHKPHQQLVGPG
jgi:hypothetical protein